MDISEDFLQHIPWLQELKKNKTAFLKIMNLSQEQINEVDEKIKVLRQKIENETVVWDQVIMKMWPIMYHQIEIPDFLLIDTIVGVYPEIFSESNLARLIYEDPNERRIIFEMSLRYKNFFGPSRLNKIELRMKYDELPKGQNGRILTVNPTFEQKLRFLIEQNPKKIWKDFQFKLYNGYSDDYLDRVKYLTDDQKVTVYFAYHERTQNRWLFKAALDHALLTGKIPPLDYSLTREQLASYYPEITEIWLLTGIAF